MRHSIAARLVPAGLVAAPLIAIALLSGCGGGDGGGASSSTAAQGQVASGPQAGQVASRRERRARTERRRLRAERARRGERRRAKERRRAAARAAARRGARQRRAAARQQTASNCDPSYRGACLDPNASDYDCAGGSGNGPKYVQGPIQVVGPDHFDLDRDGDGTACE